MSAVTSIEPSCVPIASANPILSGEISVLFISEVKDEIKVCDLDYEPWADRNFNDAHVFGVGQIGEVSIFP